MQTGAGKPIVSSASYRLRLPWLGEMVWRLTTQVQTAQGKERQRKLCLPLLMPKSKRSDAGGLGECGAKAPPTLCWSQ